jgi:hypothetical protein
MKSQITEQYKKEVSDILSKIGEGLGETVLERIEPKITSLSKNNEDMYSVINQFKEDNLTFTKTIQEDFFNDLVNLKKELGKTSQEVLKSQEQLKKLTKSNYAIIIILILGFISISVFLLMR